MIYTVALEDGTVGKINDSILDGQSAADFVGKEVKVNLHDENGNPVEIKGKLAEVLSESEF